MLGLRKPGLWKLGLMLGLAVALFGMLDGSGRVGVRSVNAEEYSERDFDTGSGEQVVLNGGMEVGEEGVFGSVVVGKGWTLEEINEELQVWFPFPPPLLPIPHILLSIPLSTLLIPKYS